MRLLVVFIFLFCTTLQAQEDFTVGQPLSPYDRGATEEDITAAITKDLEIMLEHYKGNDCFRKEVVGQCKVAKNLSIGFNGYDIYPCRRLWKMGVLKDTVDMFAYYVPFQKVETVQTPYMTAYLPKEEVEGYVGGSEESLYDGLKEAIEADFDRVAQVAEENEFGIEKEAIEELKNNLDDILPDLKENLKDFSLKNHRLRNPFRGDGRYMEMHVLPTGFDILESNRNERYEDIWTHQGAKNSWITVKNPVPVWFSEFPEHILVTRFSDLARKVIGIKEEMIPAGMSDQCLHNKISFTTPESLFEGPLAALKKETDPKYCLPLYYGPKFPIPFNFDKDTVYATQAATKRDWMALRLALALGKAIGAASPKEKAAFHELQEMDDYPEKGKRKEHKRDMMQFLDDRRRTMYESCFADGEHYLPVKIDNTYLWGPNYKKEANKNIDGERFVSAHYRYVRGCPRCYLPTQDSPNVILK